MPVDLNTYLQTKKKTIQESEQRGEFVAPELPTLKTGEPISLNDYLGTKKQVLSQPQPARQLQKPSTLGMVTKETVMAPLVAGRGVAKFVASLPSVAGGLMMEAGERAEEEPGIYDYLKATVAVSPLGWLSIYNKKILSPLFKKTDIDEKIAQKGIELIQKNQEYVNKKFPRPETPFRRFTEDLGMGAGSLGLALGLSVLTKKPELGQAIASTTFGVMAKSRAYQEARTAGKTPREAGEISNLVGMGEGGLEYIGLDIFLKNYGKPIKNAVIRMASEGLQEVSQSLSESGILRLTGVTKENILSILKQAAYEGILGSIVAGPTSVFMTPFESKLRKAGLDDNMVKQTIQNIQEKSQQTAQNISDSITPEELDKISKDITVDDRRKYEQWWTDALAQIHEGRAGEAGRQAVLGELEKAELEGIQRIPGIEAERQKQMPVPITQQPQLAQRMPFIRPIYQMPGQVQRQLPAGQPITQPIVRPITKPVETAQRVSRKAELPQEVWKTAELYNLVYKGDQDGTQIFEVPETKSTVSIPPDNLTSKELSKVLRQHYKDWGLDKKASQVRVRPYGAKKAKLIQLPHTEMKAREGEFQPKAITTEQLPLGAKVEIMGEEHTVTEKTAGGVKIQDDGPPILLDTGEKIEVDRGEVKEGQPDIEISSEVTDSYKGQINGNINAMDKSGKRVGLLQYQQFEDEVLIAWIKVSPKMQKQGIGTKLYNALKSEWPDKKIKWGMTTPEGTALRKSIEKQKSEIKKPPFGKVKPKEEKVVTEKVPKAKHEQIVSPELLGQAKMPADKIKTKVEVKPITGTKGIGLFKTEEKGEQLKIEKPESISYYDKNQALRTAKVIERTDKGVYVQSDIGKKFVKNEQIKKPTKKAESHLMTSFQRITSIVGKKQNGQPIIRKNPIVENIQNTLNKPIRTGQFRRTVRGMPTRGIYKEKIGVIRTRTAQDIEVIAHEAAHAIQEHLFGKINEKEYRFNFGQKGKQSKIIDELMNLDYDQIKRRTSEGFAEFVRHYINGENEAKKRAPTFYPIFEEYMKNNEPELYDMLQKAREDWKRWRDQPAVSQVLSQVSINQKENKIPTLTDLYTLAIDDLTPINRMVKELSEERPINTTNDPYVGARLMRGWDGIVEHFLQRGTLNWNRETTGRGLNEILKPIENKLDDWRAYAVAKRAMELKERFPDKDMIELSGFTEQAAQETISKLETPEMQKVTKEIYKYQDDLLKWLVETGVIEKELYTKIKTLNQYYIPFFRVMEEQNIKQLSSRKFGNIAKPIKRIKGSGREIIDPIESIIKNTYTAINLGLRNKVANQIYDIKDRKGAGKWVEEVPLPMGATQISIDELEKLLRNKGVDFSEVEDEVINIFRPSKFPAPTDHMYVLKEGKRKLLRLDPELYKAVTALNTTQQNWLIKLLSAPARMLRAGATLTPEFMGRNPVRDNFTAYVYSKYGFKPGIDFVKGLFHAIGRDDILWKFKASGADHSMLVSMDRSYLSKKAKDILASKRSKLIKVATHPIETLRMLSEFSELGTRLGEFTKGIKKEKPELEGLLRSGLSAREVTLDFSRTGKPTFKTLNQVIAFFNAQLQGVDKMFREFKTNPKRATVRSLVSITLPSMLLWLINHDDDDYKELPRWQKDLFWIIPMPEAFKKINLFGDYYLRIPKPFELGLLFGSLAERTLDWLYENDKDAMKEWVKSARESFLPEFLPTGIKPLIENYANKSFFYDSPIVSQYLIDQGVEAGLQAREYTSESAKFIGELINYSPAKIDNLFRGYFGGLGTHITNLTDKAVIKIKGIDLPTEPEKGITDWPLLKGFLVKNPSSSMRSIDKFWDQWEKVNGVYNTYKLLLRTDKEKAEKYNIENELLLTQYQSMKELKNIISDLNSEIKSIYNDTQMNANEKRTKIDAIYRSMSNFTRDIGNDNLLKTQTLTQVPQRIQVRPITRVQRVTP